MTEKTGPDKIEEIQKERARRLERYAETIRKNAGGDLDLHKLASGLQDQAHTEEQLLNLSGEEPQLSPPEDKPKTSKPKKDSRKNNSKFDPCAKEIPF